MISIKKQTEKSNDEEATTLAMRELEKELQTLEDLGCVLKDMSTGLVDFPAVRLGTRVWLCWRLEEDSVAFWHGLHEGFGGRKAVVKDEFYEDDVAIKSITGNA